MSSVHIHKINGKSFVSGLQWETMHYPRAYMTEARARGKQLDMDIVAIRKGESIQAGFVSRTQGVTKHMYSLAAVLADVFPEQTWIGVFKLDHYYTLVAVERGVILPQCDLVGSAEVIRERLHERYSTVEWQKVYLPSEFDFGGEEIALSSLLTRQHVKRKHRLKPLTLGLSRREWLTLLSIVLLSGLSYAGWLTWQEVEASRAQEAEQRRQKALAALKARSEHGVSLSSLNHPWADQPSVPTFVSTCTSVLGSLPLSVGGWVLEAAQCHSRGVKATYARRLSVTAEDFLTEAKRYFGGNPQWDAGGDKATMQKAHTMKASGDERLLDLDERITSFVSVLQGIEIKPTLTQAAPPVIPATASAPTVIPFQTLNFSLSTEWSMPIVFQSMPTAGMRLSSIAMTLNEETAVLSWKAEGTLYAK